MVNGVPLENAANSSEETMPLPYCSEPSKAAAEPAILFGTAARAAMMAFMLNITNSGATTPQIPPMFAHTSANNTAEAAKAIRGQSKAGYQFSVEKAQAHNANDVDAEQKSVVLFRDTEIINVNKGRSGNKGISGNVEKGYA